MKTALGLLALALLLALDYLLIVSAFLYRPAGSEIFMILVPAAAILALILRRGWPIYAAQGAVSALVVMRVAQSFLDTGIETSGSPIIDTAVIAAELALGYALAWLVARAIPPRASGMAA